jgi:hypothetical protein
MNWEIEDFSDATNQQGLTEIHRTHQEENAHSSYLHWDIETQQHQ